MSSSITKPKRRRKFPNLNPTSKKLIISGFDAYIVLESPDFNTSNEESDTEEEEIQKPQLQTSRLDRIRTNDGTIDLGLQRTDFAKDSNMIDEKRCRKMINYDGISIPKGPKGTSDTREITVKSKPDKVIVPYEFGDSGSTWRLIKLNKLGKNPSKSLIFEHFKTLWDYELSCMERDELESRKYKPKSKWIYKPNQKFLDSKKSHDIINKHVVREIKQRDGNTVQQNKDINEKEEEGKEEEEEEEEDDDDGEIDSVINLKKYSNVKISKTKRLRNELKLVNLMKADYDNDNDYSLNRETIESLTNSP